MFDHTVWLRHRSRCLLLLFFVLHFMMRHVFDAFQWILPVPTCQQDVLHLVDYLPLA